MLKNTALESKPQPMCAKQIPGWCVEHCDAVLRRGTSQENTFTQTMVPGMGDHSPPAAPVKLLNRASLYGAFEAEVLGEPAELTLGFRLIGDGRDLAIYHIP